MPYRLTVYRPIDRKKSIFEGDAQVEGIVGQESNGAGTDLVTLIRDMSFEFEDEGDADKARDAAENAGFSTDLEEDEE